MFFMIGITDRRKDLDHSQTIVCHRCGRYGSYRVYMIYTVLLLFFIPCFKWNRRYFVETSCCGTVYELNPDIGKRIERGEQTEIRDQDLTPTGYSQGYGAQYGYNIRKRCRNCGYETDEDFQFCPKCGRQL